MASEGVLYYTVGSKCAIKACVSLSALRDHYSGPVCLIAEGPQPDWFLPEWRRLGADVVEIPKSGRPALVQKASLWRHSPFDVTLFFDADTLPRCDPSELFPVIREAGFVVHHFHDWRTRGVMMGKRIRNWGAVRTPEQVEAALDFGPAVNTGVFGWTPDASILPEWETLTRAGQAANCTTRIVDETACQMLLPFHPHRIIGPEWGSSVRFGDPDTARIIHYHGYKNALEWPACRRWKEHYWRYRHSSPAYRALGKIPRVDQRMRRYMAACKEAGKRDITIVSAVNKRYWAKFVENVHWWRRLPGIMEQQFLVFAHGDETICLLDGLFPNMRVVPWDYPGAVNDRERMLSAFVLGTAEHVHTPYWMKLDADATPTGKAWDWGDYEKYTITGHRCGYTKTKGLPGAERHFLNMLDAWYKPAEKFPEIPARERYGHSRVASYCWIERTEFTRELARLCNGRLPIPSHDTLAWYVAHQRGEKIKRRNMRRYFRP